MEGQNDIDFTNYKGMYYNDTEQDNKYFDPRNGAHFAYNDLYNRLSGICQPSQKHLPRNIHIVQPQLSDGNPHPKIIINSTTRKLLFRHNQANRLIINTNSFKCDYKNIKNIAETTRANMYKNISNVINSSQSFNRKPSEGYSLRNKGSNPKYDIKGQRCKLPFVEGKRSIIIGQKDYNFLSFDLRKDKDAKNVLRLSKEDTLRTVLSQAKISTSRNRKEDRLLAGSDSYRNPNTLNL